jgi:hypothetical protein
MDDGGFNDWPNRDQANSREISYTIDSMRGRSAVAALGDHNTASRTSSNDQEIEVGNTTSSQETSQAPTEEQEESKYMGSIIRMKKKCAQNFWVKNKNFEKSYRRLAVTSCDDVINGRLPYWRYFFRADLVTRPTWIILMVQVTPAPSLYIYAVWCAT